MHTVRVMVVVNKGYGNVSFIERHLARIASGVRHRNVILGIGIAENVQCVTRSIIGRWYHSKGEEWVKQHAEDDEQQEQHTENATDATPIRYGKAKYLAVTFSSSTLTTFV